MSEVNNGAEAAGFARFNFSSGSSRDSIVYACERAGMRNEYDKPGAIPVESMNEWKAFMEAQEIKQGLSLMTDEEMTWFPEPGLLAAGLLPSYSHVVTKAPGAGKEIVGKLRAAEAAGEKIVVHCCAGQHRTGTVLAAWLVARYGLSAEEAVEEVLSHAAANKVRRGAEAAKVMQLLEQ
eukprot:gnl/TRDRNA2_/TRDRNA2_91943_c0_seq1.p1 gnl/TRDRNA2_/TRDRNA2_91943_c0~~gnl/TRDRNA2_/TRDRNA2_91943_c0_seq1.p1  ORF type:complete len:186 (-),score=34.39 gnl/TRDRNA2_/TRDRNA2_91943_c0_seq1:110-646(-)